MKVGMMASILALDRRRLKQECYIETLDNIENYTDKTGKKHIDCIEGRRERSLINESRTYRIRTIIEYRKFYRVLKN